MINNALKRLGKKPISRESSICTLEIARKKFPGSKNNLNALCRRFGVSLESREKHGALTDSFLLLQVYNELLGGKQQLLELDLKKTDIVKKSEDALKNNKLSPIEISQDEIKEHEKMLEELHKNVWSS